MSDADPWRRHFSTTNTTDGPPVCGIERWEELTLDVDRVTCYRCMATTAYKKAVDRVDDLRKRPRRSYFMR